MTSQTHLIKPVKMHAWPTIYLRATFCEGIYLRVSHLSHKMISKTFHAYIIMFLQRHTFVCVSTLYEYANVYTS